LCELTRMLCDSRGSNGVVSKLCDKNEEEEGGSSIALGGSDNDTAHDENIAGLVLYIKNHIMRYA
jgi:hypothetical protein